MKECFAYIDEVLVNSPDYGSHLAHLQEVIVQLRKAGLKFKTKKCMFWKPTVFYHEDLVTSEGIQPYPKNTSRVISYPARFVPQGRAWTA